MNNKITGFDLFNETKFMSKLRTTVPAFFFSALFFFSLNIVTLPSHGDDDFKYEVSASNKQVTKLITQLLDKYHYKKPVIDNEFSSDFFDQYINNLDPNRSYFLTSDLESFEEFRYSFDNFLKKSQLQPAYEIFSRYRERALDRISYANSVLDTSFDFLIDDEYQIDRNQEEWKSTQADLNRLWIQRVKYDWLALKLTGESDNKIYDLLNARYKNIERRLNQISEKDVFDIVINTYLSSIEPHTSFFTASATENFKIKMSLSLEGIGAVLKMENEYTVVHRILPGGPADLTSNLKAGDRITGVGQNNENLVDTVGWRLDDVVDLIRGPKGSIVRLQILPKTEPIGGVSRTIEIVRDTIRLEEQAASHKIYEIETEYGPKNIGVIDIPTFYVDFDAQARGESNYRSTTRDLRVLLKQLNTEDIDGLIIDLRGNGGGSLIEAISATGLFIKSGPIVQIKTSNGKIDVRKDPDPNILSNHPLAILVDRDSASASEIFAGAIQDYGRGYIFGEGTFGKGTVQNLVALNNFTNNPTNDLGQLKLTIAQFFRVTGESTQFRGVNPDIIIPETYYRPNQRELTNKNAMPWSAIKPIPFTVYDEGKSKISDEQWSNLQIRHQLRIKKNPIFQYLTEKVKIDSELAQKNIFSLVESRRYTERDSHDSNIDTLKNLLLSLDKTVTLESLERNDFSEEAVLLESAKILTDIIALKNYNNQ